MTTITRWNIPRTPVARAEQQHQTRLMEATRSGTLWIGLAYVLLYPALAISLVLYFGALLLDVFPALSALVGVPTVTVGFAASTLLIAMNVALYVVVTLVSLGLSASSIGREKQGKTWDSLLLTGVNARQIVLGKWSATLHTLWPDFALVWMLRLGMIAWLIAIGGGEFLYHTSLAGLPPRFFTLLLTAAMVAAHTAIDAGLTAALGLLGALVEGQGAAAALLIGVGRLVWSIAPLVVPYYVFATYEMHDSEFHLLFWGAFMLVSAALTALLLRWAEGLAVRQHALPA